MRPINHSVEELTVAEPTVRKPTVAEPTVREPTVAEPTVREPTVAEPTVREPTVGEPTVREPLVVEPRRRDRSSDFGRSTKRERQRPCRFRPVPWIALAIVGCLIVPSLQSMATDLETSSYPALLIEWQVTINGGRIEEWFLVVVRDNSPKGRSSWSGVFYDEDGQIQLALHLSLETPGGPRASWYPGGCRSPALTGGHLVQGRLTSLGIAGPGGYLGARLEVDGQGHGVETLELVALSVRTIRVTGQAFDAFRRQKSL